MKSKTSREAETKFGAVAKLAYTRKKTVSEVIPPDVTRAKAGKWLDLISPITEWAGLKGDALRYQRQQLRIQQEAALDRLAELVRRKMEGQKVVQPLPPKIIVPALEGASIESVESPLIEWWANILVSGATGGSIRPYFVDLMKAIGYEEAKCLNDIWQEFSTIERYVSGEINVGRNIAFTLMEWTEENLTQLRGRSYTDETYPDFIWDVTERIGSKMETRGIPTEVSIPLGQHSKSSLPVHTLSITRRSQLYEKPATLEVCLALNLLKEGEVSIELDFSRHTIGIPAGLDHLMDVKYIYPTDLGIEFLLACQPITPHASGTKARRSRSFRAKR